MATLEIWLADALLFAGLALLGLGHFLAGERRRLKLPGEPVRYLAVERNTGHLISATGYLAFGLFWVLQVQHFLDIADPVNAIFAAAALPFFSYLAYHEYLSYDWDEIYPPLRWLGATAVVAGAIYFGVDRFPYITGGLVKVVADQSAWLLSLLFDYPSHAGNIDYGEPVSHWFRPGAGHELIRVPLVSEKEIAENAPHINIVLACTALQSMIVFIGGILCTRVKEGQAEPRFELPLEGRAAWLGLPLVCFGFLLALVVAAYALPGLAWLFIPLGLAWIGLASLLLYYTTSTRRLKAFLITVPVIYLLNLFRNGLVTFLTYEGLADFEVAHSYVGKGGSLLALIILAVATFNLLPELHDNILGLFDLPKRKRGGGAPPEESMPENKPLESEEGELAQATAEST